MATNTFRDAALLGTGAVGLTENGMPTHLTSGSACVDLFFAIGASRGKDLSPQFEAAYRADRTTALRTLLWARDVRGGSGEREQARTLLRWLERHAPQDAVDLVPHLPVFGRWDDLLAFETEPLRRTAFTVIAGGLADPQVQGLVAKWLPRMPSTSPSASKMAKGKPRRTLSDYQRTRVATVHALRAFLGLSERDYRKLLAGLTRVVEQKMCAGAWDSIEFGKLPSLASARLQKAFARRAPDAYAAYKASLAKGEAKVNAGAVYPYDVIKSIKQGDAAVAAAQWEALPNYLGDDMILPMVDVSASMNAPVGGNPKMTRMDMSIALGLYVASKQRGPFADMFLTFSERPSFVHLEGDIVAKERQTRRADWGGNTDLEAAFQLMLDVAVANHLAPEQMPKVLLVLSDMEFDEARGASQQALGFRRGAGQPKDTAFEMARSRYAAAGYPLPRIVFWNLAARAGNNPVTMRQDGTALVSGYSPALLRSVLATDLRPEQFTPEAIMRATVDIPRYAEVVPA